jgi:hypothetical protein
MGATIEEIIKQMAKSTLPVQVVVCKVLSVDKSKCIIDAKPVNGNADILDARLKAVITDDANGLIVYPAKGSHVLVNIINNDIKQCYVSLMDKVESAKLTIEGNEMTLDKNKAVVKWKLVEFNGGNLGGFIKIVELVKRINIIEALVNALITWANLHVHTTTAPGSPTTPSITPFTQTLQPTTVAHIENPKIKH